jgi:hypothetical protein
VYRFRLLVYVNHKKHGVTYRGGEQWQN